MFHNDNAKIYLFKCFDDRHTFFELNKSHVCPACAQMVYKLSSPYAVNISIQIKWIYIFVKMIIKFIHV